MDIFREGSLALRAHGAREIRDHLTVALAPAASLEPQIAGSSFDFEHRCAILPHFSVHRIRYGAPVLMDIPGLRDKYILQVLLSGRSDTIYKNSNVVMESGMVTALNVGEPFTKVLSQDAEQLLFCFNACQVNAIAASTLSDFAGNLRFFPSPLRIDKAPMLFDLINAVCTAIESHDPVLASSRTSERMADLMVDLMIRYLPAESGRRCLGAVPFHVQKAEAFMRENFREAITLAEVASAAGVTKRCLCINFRRFRNTSPMAYLRLHRLTQARKMLESTQARASVTEVAGECALHHLGRFSQEYRLEFGELPSQTIERVNRAHLK
ncbi:MULTISPECIES: AraC family transcriptional regulator [Burkholderiales]|uniref:AraC family transcriptional regulator n=8 Tax=Burkholderiales TaxID=80840 RepID=A0A7M2HBW7_9BURK|nr:MULTISPECIES: AraC family transcriptional regulator [Burkholderiales]QOT82444.1 AraC family transcriptional regulator [Cupriavidus basilensis]